MTLCTAFFLRNQMYWIRNFIKKKIDNRYLCNRMTVLKNNLNSIPI